jgi:outer membrane receptor protein involved in Fe transport
MQTRVTLPLAFRRLLLILLLISAPTLHAPEASAQSSRLEGVVTDRSSAQPVPGATVSIAGAPSGSVTTDRNGRFTLDTTASRVSLRVDAPGYLGVNLADVTVGSQPVRVELNPTPNFLERVQVTAAKDQQKIGDLAGLADIVERSAIDSRGDQTLTQAVANLPGVIVSGQAGSFDSVMLRGLPREGNEFTNTLLLIDGVPQVDSRNSARIIALPIGDASRIEVVRGPNSALYGRTAIGGAINVRTADPTPAPQLRVDFTGGEFSTLKGGAAVSGPATKRLGYYVSAEKEHNGGYYDSVTDFAIDKWGLFGKLTFVPDAKSFASVSVNRVESDDSTPTNEPVIDGVFLSTIDPSFKSYSSFNLPGPNYHQGETRLTVNYQRQVTSWVRLVEVFGYRRIQYKFLPDGDVIGSPFDIPAHMFTQYPFEQETNEDIYYEEARAEFNVSRRGISHSVIAGGSYEHNGGGTNGQLIFTDPDTEGWPLNYRAPVFPPASDWDFDPYGSTYNVGITALFGQYTVTPVPRWILTAGGRYDRLSLDNTPLGGIESTATFDAFSPKVSATYKAIAPASDSGTALNVYGTYSQAFLPPRRPSQLTPTTETLDLKPEDISNYEGGLKALVANGRLSLEAAYFDMTRDGIVVTVRQGPFFIPSNAGSQKFRGVETGARWTQPRLSLYANASFYHNRFGDYVIQSSGGDTVLTGNRLPIAPDTVLNAGMTFTPVRAVDVAVEVKRIGEVALDQINSVTLEGYTLVDAAATWRRGPLRITLSAHNLFNAHYYWNGDTSIGESADPGRPRQVLVSTSFVLK